MESKTKAFLRISVLQWADLLVAYAFFVMQDYLTDIWNLSITHAATILNIWSGISMILPFFFLFLVDSKLGHFRTLVLSSIAYTSGIGLITLSTPPALANSTHTCKQYKSECIGETQKVIFYVGMALLAVGTAGQSVTIKPLLEEEGISPSHGCCNIKSLIRKIIIPVVGGIIFASIKTWSLLFGIPAIGSAVALILFLSGWNTYKKEPPPPEGCAFMPVCRVFVAAARKITQPFSADPESFHKEKNESFISTRCLRCLEKAAMILPGEVGAEGEVKNRWKLCSVAEVEDAKIAVRMVPMWMTFIVMGIVSSIGNTYFIEQASNMNRHLGKWNVPLPVLLLILNYYKFSTQIGLKLDFFLCEIFVDDADCARVVNMIATSQGMIYAILCCIAAAAIEKRRLKAMITHGLLDKPDEVIPMSAFWLIFQFILLAWQEAYFKKGVSIFFKGQAPESMSKYLDQLSRGVCGLGYMFGVLSVYVCGRVSQIGGRKSWFQFTLNESRLDRYYWFLAALSSVNLVAFIVMSVIYKYKRGDNAQDKEMDGSQTSHRTGGPTKD